MRKYKILGALGAVLVSTTFAWSQLTVPAPSWAYAITALGTNVATFLSANLTLNGAAKFNGSGVVSQAACADLSNGSGTACNQTYTATTWTPVVTTDGTVGTPAYSVQVGSYEQVGRQYTVRFHVTLSGWTGSPTGNVAISGLPVASANTTNDRGACTISTWSLASGSPPYADILPNTSQIRLLVPAAQSVGLMSAAIAGTTFSAAGMCNYHT